MKRILLWSALLIAALLLTGCGGKDNAAASDEPVTQLASVGGAQAEASITETAPLSEDEAFAAVAAQEEQMEAEQTPSSDEARPVDLDLTKLSGTVVYSQVYDMMMNPDGYMGQRIKMKGNFSYFQDPDTKQEYFAAIIADATACCAQGIEFVWKGEHTYPQDYPQLDTEITVTGTFSTYYEGEIMYIQLDEADVDW